MRSTTHYAILASAILIVGTYVGYTMFVPKAALPEVDLNGAPAAVSEAFAARCKKLQADPQSATKWGELGMFLMAHQSRSAALECFQQARILGPRDFRWPYLTGVLWEEEDFAAASEAYASAIQLHPHSASARLRYAAVLLRLNQTDKAKAQYEQAAKLFPKDCRPQMHLASLALNAGDIAAARKNLEAAAKLAPTICEVHTELARVHLLANDIPLAVREQQEAQRWPPALNFIPDPVLQQVEELEVVARGLSNRALMTGARGDHAAAEKQFRTIVATRPELTRARLNLGLSLFAQQRMDEAIAVYRDTIKTSPEIAETYYNLGSALESIGDLKGAEESYEAATRRKADYAEAYFAQGLLCEKQGRVSEAITAYRRAIEAGPQLARAHLALGAALAQSKNREEAIQHVRIAVRLAPGDPVSQRYLDQLMKESTP